MRSETEIRDNLEWLKEQCANFKDDEKEVVIRQAETLLWVLGHERNGATEMAKAIWHDSRTHRNEHRRDYS